VRGDLDSGSLVRVYPNVPNPSAGLTTFSYALKAGNDVAVHVLDASGRVVRDLFTGHQSAGTYEMGWNTDDNSGQPVPNGVYFARITVGGETQVREVTVLR
jgi:flagellar hook assembly protein FlgD